MGYRVGRDALQNKKILHKRESNLHRPARRRAIPIPPSHKPPFVFLNNKIILKNIFLERTIYTALQIGSLLKSFFITRDGDRV